VESAAYVPYCGAPPLPESLWSRWNTDPVLLAALLLFAIAYAAMARRRGFSRAARLSFYAGWGITAAALVSPLCALSVSLFSARVGQHMILALLGAPLVAAGLAAIEPAGRRLAPLYERAAASPFLSATAFAVLLWFWHAPAPYAATFASTAVYWAMHVTVYGSAVWLWRTVLAASLTTTFAVLGAAVVSSVQMGLLGALITFAPRPMYAPHALTTAAWGLTPLSDQQLGGAIMWVPGCIVFLAVAMVMFWQAMEQADRPALQVDRR
jgi:putative membrane protein